MRVALAAAAALTVAGCGTGRLLSYGTQMSDAVVRMGPAAFSVYVHPKDDTLLIQRRVMQTTNHDSAELIRIAGTQFVQPVGCSITEVRSIAAGSWEAGFACPPDVDLRALASEQRAQLQAGASLHR